MASAMFAMAWPDWMRRSHASVEFLKSPSLGESVRTPLEPSAWHDWQEFLTVSIQAFCERMNSGMPLPLALVPGNWPLSGICSIEYQYSRVASSLSVFCGPRPPHVVGNPSLRESVKLVLLCLGVIFRCVAHVNPVD